MKPRSSLTAALAFALGALLAIALAFEPAFAARQTITQAPGSWSVPSPNANDTGAEDWQTLLSKTDHNFGELYGGVLAGLTNAQTISALAGGAQAGTALILGLNNVTTVTTSLDSVQLPTSTAGSIAYVYNATTNTLAVFGQTGDTINGAAANAAAVVGPAQIGVFEAYAAGAWRYGIVTHTIKAFSYAAATNTTGFTASAAQIAGGGLETDLDLTGTLGAGAALTTPTAAAVIAARPTAKIGDTWKLRVLNDSGGAFAWTLTAGSGFSLAGTAQTVAQTTYRDWLCTITSMSAITCQSLGQVAISAAP
jgi:hypothetical protein